MINTIRLGLFRARHLSILTCLVLAIAVMPGCDYAKNLQKPDRAAGLEMQDYKDGLASRLPEDEDEDSDRHGNGASIPPLQPYMAQGSSSMKSMPLVSISVNQSVSLRDVLFELAEQADYDIELDPRIGGSVIFTARNRPFDQVIDRICDIAGLRYRFKDDVLRVELDLPYNQTYKIDYLSYIRSNSSSVRNDIAVVSGDGADTGSSFSAQAESEADFWGELDLTLAQILGGATGSLITSTTPRIVATEQNPDVEAVAPPSENGEVVVQPPEAVLNVESLPLDGDVGGAPSSGGSGDNEIENTYAINKQAGLVSVFANERSQKKVVEYLRDLRRSVTAQVLIEAKILEVTLSDEYITGIDWNEIGLFGNAITTGFMSNGSPIGSVTPTNFPLPATTSNSVVSGNRNVIFGYNGSNVQALIDAISGFGTVRALASPRMTVLNNQSAVLNVATNQVFFEVDIDITQDGGGGSQTDIDSDIRNVPEGVLMNVLPSINLEDRTVSLALRPTITRVVAEIEDPAIQFVTASAGITGVQSLIPELNVQEIDSVIQVNSGQAIVMGGLLQDRSTVTEEGVPIAAELPLIGGLFRDHTDLITKTELVIFLKATILDSPEDSIQTMDRDLYRKFSDDRRPFKI